MPDTNLNNISGKYLRNDDGQIFNPLVGTNYVLDDDGNPIKNNIHSFIGAKNSGSSSTITFPRRVQRTRTLSNNVKRKFSNKWKVLF